MVLLKKKSKKKIKLHSNYSVTLPTLHKHPSPEVFKQISPNYTKQAKNKPKAIQHRVRPTAYVPGVQKHLISALCQGGIKFRTPPQFLRVPFREVRREEEEHGCHQQTCVKTISLPKTHPALEAKTNWSRLKWSQQGRKWLLSFHSVAVFAIFGGLPFLRSSME